jgi:nitroreductase
MELKELLGRRTIRKFSQKKVKKADIQAMIEAARCASCASNRQRLRYIGIVSPEKVAAILPHTFYAALVKPRRTPVPCETSPTAFLAVTATEKPSPHVYADAGAAIQSIEFAAWERGIGCCWLGSFLPEKVAPILDFPDPERIVYLVALGHPAEDPVSEDIPAGGDAKYYLDENDTLHVPKFTVDALTCWM